MGGPRGDRSSASSAGSTTDWSVDLEASPKLREIVEQAAALFDERGYHRVSMEEIAAAVGIRKPSLYHYVRSKDEILTLIHREFMDLVISRAEARQAVAMSPEQQLLEFMADILELMHTHRGHVRVFFEHHRELPDAEREAVRQERDRYEAMVEAVIRQGIASGAFRPMDARLTTLALFGMCNWAYQWYRRGGPLRTREIAYAFWDLLLRGLRPD
ncbi:MAG TPA: TetR/AcrR family transcriptional regulator [Candidatus Dormibacteraeota bacterium]|nr:TetR/AcrR family transcriptional regulator [Candidatus Dormibacteraeota bacterium]